MGRWGSGWGQVEKNSGGGGVSGGGWVGGRVGGGGQGGFERRIEVIVKMQKNRGVGGSGPAVDGGLEKWWLAEAEGVGW